MRSRIFCDGPSGGYPTHASANGPVSKRTIRTSPSPTEQPQFGLRLSRSTAVCWRLPTQSATVVAIGPKELRLDKLIARAVDGVVKEVILATNYTNEGEATAHYIEAMLRSKGVSVSRIARGVPVGGELEYVDSGTLAQALRERRLCGG